MIIVGLIIAIVVCVAVVFLVIRSVAMKLLSMALLVLALVLVTALSGNRIGQIVRPITITETSVQIYQEDKPIKFEHNQVSRVDVKNGSEGGVIITFHVITSSYQIQMGKLTYEWSVKNALHKTFSRVLYDVTYS